MQMYFHAKNALKLCEVTSCSWACPGQVNFQLTFCQLWDLKTILSRISPLFACFHFRPELFAVWNRLKYYILILKPWTFLFSGRIIRRLKKTDEVFWLCGIQSDTREMKTILSFHFYEGSITAETRLFQGFSLFFACSDFRPELFEVWKGLKYFNVYSTPSVWN